MLYIKSLINRKSKMKNKVIVFKEYMLHTSERFVLDQAQNIKNFDVTLMGLNKLKYIPFDDMKVVCLDAFSKLQIILYKLLGFSPKLVSLIKNENPDILHIHMGGDAARFTAIRNKFNIPVIATFHGTDATTSDYWKKKSNLIYHRQYPGKRQNIIKDIDHFIAVSEYVKKAMIKQGYPEQKITVNYMGIDIDFFSKSNIQVKREKIVVFVGRLVKIKGCEYLIQAMSHVKKVVPDSKLVIIGDGQEASSLKELSNKNNVNAEFLGVQKKEIIKEYLQKASVFCCPSITMDSGGAEGLGIVFLEAQAMGVPVVSFLSGGIPEAVLNNKTGFLYSEKDIIGLSTGIITLLTNNILWKEFSINCKKHINLNFDIKKQTLLLEDIYKQLISDYKKNPL